MPYIFHIAFAPMAIYLCVALVLIVTQRLGPRHASKSRQFAEEISRPRARTIDPVPFAMRDGYPLPVRVVQGPEGAPLCLLLHGSGWHGQQLEDLALRLSDAATVAVPDLRGHGAMPEVRGDVHHLGQIEEDMADLIGHLQAEGQAVVMAGHSSGAGAVIRFCAGPEGKRAHAAVLMAPYLHHKAPTHRKGPGGWADLLTRRLLGLEMLNALGIHALDGLDVVQFAMPQAVLDGPMGYTATLRYTHRLNASMLPRRHWWRDVKRLPDFTLIVGDADRAFRGASFAPLFQSLTGRGTYHLVPGVGHPDVVHHPMTEYAFREVLDACPRSPSLRPTRRTRRPGTVSRTDGDARAAAEPAVSDLGLQHRDVARAVDDT